MSNVLNTSKYCNKYDPDIMKELVVIKYFDKIHVQSIINIMVDDVSVWQFIMLLLCRLQLNDSSNKLQMLFNDYRAFSCNRISPKFSYCNCPKLYFALLISIKLGVNHQALEHIRACSILLLSNPSMWSHFTFLVTL